MDEWYATYYREHYRNSVRGLLTPARTADEVSFILRETHLTPPATVADVACGEGRHAIALARRGFQVMGVDLNSEFIATAREEATGLGEKARFFTGDMREAIGGPYQMVLSLFQSFGFFDDADNTKVLHAWTRRLTPGGYLVLDLWNRDFIVRKALDAYQWEAEPGLRVTEHKDFDSLSGRLAIHYTYTYAEGQQFEYDAHFRLYAPTELRDLLASVGIEITSVYGSLTGDPYTLDARRLVVFGRTERRQPRLNLGPSVRDVAEDTAPRPVIVPEVQ